MSTSDDKQPGPGSTSPSTESSAGVHEFVGRVSDNLHELDLDPQTSELLQEHIKTVRSQLGSTAPDHPLVGEALQAMRRLLSSSSTQRATELLAEAGRFLTGVG